jgi:hypothetical protein
MPTRIRRNDPFLPITVREERDVVLAALAEGRRTGQQFIPLNGVDGNPVALNPATVIDDDIEGV